MLKLTFRNFLILLLIIFLAVIFQGCEGCEKPAFPPVITGIISGRVADPIVSAGDIIEYIPIANAEVTIVDADGVTHTTYTDSEGYYHFDSLSVKANTIINIIKELSDGGKKVYKDIVPLAVSSEENYDAGIADAVSTALALVVEELINLDQSQEEIDLDEITSSDGFDELKEDVQQAQEDNQDINTDLINTQAEEIAYNIVNPPEPESSPSPAPAPSPTYTVTFNSQGGSAVSSQTVEHGGKVTEPTDPTREGYTFGGWYKEAGCTNVWIFTTDTVTSNVTLYAKWDINTYTLVINKTGSGTGTTTPTLGNHTYDYGTEVTISASPAISSIFNGWSGDATGTSNVTLTMNENKSVTAAFDIKTYTITASAGANGSISPSGAVGVNHGADQSFTITPATGYHIADVKVDDSSVGAVSSYTFTNVTADHTIAATFAINSYTVTFNSQGGSAVSSQTVEHGGKVTEPTDPTREGYTFGGWYKEAGCTNVWIFTTDTVTSNVTLYAKWTPLYALRDTGPAGGLIFYVKEGGYSDGWMYLEAAPVSTEWTSKEWGSYETLIGGTGTDIGTGQSNTTVIVTWLDANENDTYGDVTNKTDRAAYLCDALTVGDYSDWFLPSKDELNLMYTELKVHSVGGFADGNYWSSSEDSANYAWYQHFGYGSQSYDCKPNTFRVRAVRAF